MNYVKLTQGRIQYAPKKIKDGLSTIYNPTADILLAHGYKPLTVNPMPTMQSGYHAVPSYTEIDSEIIQSWTVEADPPMEPTLEEQVEAQAEAIEELAMLLAEVMG